MHTKKIILFAACFLCFIILPFQMSLSAGHKDKWAPDFLIIGAQKSGTTALYHFLHSHPLILKNKSSGGETHFFDLHFNLGLNWYKNQFPQRVSSDHLIGDKTPYYLFHPLVPKRVYNLFPEVKIIIILRNPVDRAFSQYWMNVRRNKEPLSFEEAVNAEDKRLEGEKQKIINNRFYNSFNYITYSYLSRGLYAEQISRWQEFFPNEQILILSNEELKKFPEKTMEQVFAFLGVPNYEEIDWNQTEKSKYPPMDPELRTRLTEYFRPYNEQLEELLGMKFNWG